jgi:hypothetical protein
MKMGRLFIREVGSICAAQNISFSLAFGSSFRDNTLTLMKKCERQQVRFGAFRQRQSVHQQQTLFITI